MSETTSTQHYVEKDMQTGPHHLEHHVGNNVHLPVQAPMFANPGPLGLFSFASTTLLLSLLNIQTRGLTAPNIDVGMAFACGGTAQMIAGICEFVVGNTFGFTAFVSYGSFWIAFGLLHWPSSGMITPYKESADVHALSSAVGLFLIVWMILTFILFIGSLRANTGLCALFFFLLVTYMFLVIGHMLDRVAFNKVGGAFGIFTAIIAYYVGASALWESEKIPFSLPNPSLKRK